MPHKYFLYLQALRKVTRDFPRQQMHGKPTRIPISQLRRTKKESACTGFNISFLRIFKSLLTDSNNQGTRSHTSASSTSFLKDSSYWLLICCQPGPWNKPESVQETFRTRLGSMRWLQAGPWLQGFTRVSRSQHIPKKLQGQANLGERNQRGQTAKLWGSTQLNCLRPCSRENVQSSEL